MGATQSDIANFEDPGPGVTEERIEAAVKKHEATEDVIIDSIEENLNDEGQGFMSTLVKIKVTAIVRGEKKSYSWVVKSMPRNIQQ